MLDLVAQSIEDPSKQWRKPLRSRDVTIGREPSHSKWPVEWDKFISHLHASLHLQGEQLTVRRLETGKNPILYQGSECDEFTLSPGENFVIGQTVFRLVPNESLPFPTAEFTYKPDKVPNLRDLDVEQRIEVLANLPSIIAGAPSNEELENRVVEVLLKGIPHAVSAAIVQLCHPKDSDEAKVDVRCLKEIGSGGLPFLPSRQLVTTAISSTRRSVVHIWEPGSLHPDFTPDPHFQWAMCVPLHEELSSDWGLYLRGNIPTAKGDPLRGDVKFAELVAHTFASLRQVRYLESIRNSLERFFPRLLWQELAKRSDVEEVLRPRETQVTVLFCDLRGSCGIHEGGHDNLQQLWGRINQALSLMSSSILDQQGIIADLQGDAAVGFWGWPQARDDSVKQAALAALNLQRKFALAAGQPGHPLHGLSCGIGIAHGPAIAGRLGTIEQFKIDIFGPVVNLAARLEGMTKHFGVPILVDEACAENLRDGIVCRCRQVARVLPYGMTKSLTVTEIMPLAGEPGAMSENHRRTYSTALDAFIAGKWENARKLLCLVPNDIPARKLEAYMNEQPAGPPPDWVEKCFITMTSK